MLRLCAASIGACTLMLSAQQAIARPTVIDTYATTMTSFQTPWYSSGNSGGGSSGITAYAGIDGDGAAELRGDRTRFIAGNEFFNTPITGLNMGRLSDLTAFNFQWTVTAIGAGPATAQAPALRVHARDPVTNRTIQFIWEDGEQSSPVFVAGAGTLGTTYTGDFFGAANRVHVFTSGLGRGIWTPGGAFIPGSDAALPLATHLATLNSPNAFIMGISVGVGSSVGSAFVGYADRVTITVAGGIDETYNFRVVPPELQLNHSGSCYDVGDQIIVKIDMVNQNDVIVGGQFFLEYDPTVLQLVSVAPGQAPFTQAIYHCSTVASPVPTQCLPLAGLIDYCVGIPPGGSGTAADRVMAVLTFQALQEVCSMSDLVEFRPNNPPTRLTVAGGGEVLPMLDDLEAVTIDGTAPVITCPPNITLECDQPNAPTSAWLASGTIGTGAVATPVANGVELFTPDGAAGSAYVRLTFAGGIPLSSITSLSYSAQITQAGAGGFAPEVVLNIDADNDGIVEGSGIAWMHAGHNPAALGYMNANDRGDNFLSGDQNPASGGPDMAFVSRDALGPYSYWSTDTNRSGFGGFYDSFANVLALLPANDIDANDLVYSIDIVAGTSSNFDGLEVTVQSVEVNGTVYGFGGAGSATAVDGCDPAPVIAYSDNIVAGTCPSQYTIQRTWTATDACGNSSSCVQTINVVDTTPPDVTGVPSNITVNADAGACSAVVTWTPPTATDNCTAQGSIAVTSTHDPGDTFPTGTTTVIYTFTDQCGNYTNVSFNVTVNGVNELVLDIQLQGAVAGPLTRCITFELIDCVNAPVTVQQEITFNSGLAQNVLVLVPCGDYANIAARDALHTLSRTVALSISGTQYNADFTSAEQLVGGNLNADVWIDILDFGVFVGEFGENYGTGNTTCATPAPHADINGDGQVNVLDFSFISQNFLMGNDPDGCSMMDGRSAAVPGLGHQAQQGGPISRISIKELRRQGLQHLAVADINRDGWLDQADMAAFLGGH